MQLSQIARFVMCKVLISPMILLDSERADMCYTDMLLFCQMTPDCKIFTCNVLLCFQGKQYCTECGHSTNTVRYRWSSYTRTHGWQIIVRIIPRCWQAKKVCIVVCVCVCVCVSVCVLQRYILKEQQAKHEVTRSCVLHISYRIYVY